MLYTYDTVNFRLLYTTECTISPSCVYYAIVSHNAYHNVSDWLKSMLHNSMVHTEGKKNLQAYCLNGQQKPFEVINRDGMFKEDIFQANSVIRLPWLLAFHLFFLFDFML